jgi:hypothetical protein
MRQGSFSPVHLSHEVDVHHPPDFIQGVLLEATVDRYRRHVNPGIDAPESAYSQVCYCLYLGVVGDIANGVGSFSTQSLDLSDQRGQSRFTSRGDDHLCAAFGELQPCLAPDSARRSQQHDNLFVDGLQIHG